MDNCKCDVCTAVRWGEMEISSVSSEWLNDWGDCPGECLYDARDFYLLGVIEKLAGRIEELEQKLKPAEWADE